MSSLTLSLFFFFFFFFSICGLIYIAIGLRLTLAVLVLLCWSLKELAFVCFAKHCLTGDFSIVHSISVVMARIEGLRFIILFSSSLFQYRCKFISSDRNSSDRSVVRQAWRQIPSKEPRRVWNFFAGTNWSRSRSRSASAILFFPPSFIILSLSPLHPSFIVIPSLPPSLLFSSSFFFFFIGSWISRRVSQLSFFNFPFGSRWLNFQLRFYLLT